MLTSQSTRSAGRRQYMYRRKRLPRRPLVIALVAAVVVVSIVWLLNLDRNTPELPRHTDDLTAGNLGQTTPQAGPDDADRATSGNRTSSNDRTGNAPAADQKNVMPPGSAGDSSTGERDETVAQTPIAREEASAPNVAPASQREMPALTEPRRRALARLQSGLELISTNRPVEARRVLSAALLSGALTEQEMQRIRDELTAVNQRLVFSPEVIPGDPYALSYTVEHGDFLSTIPRRFGLLVEWQFIQRINNIPKPESIREGQRLKLITGPFHAVISKRHYRLDLFMGDESERVYVCSFPVGLGEFNGTPEGLFIVRPQSKLTNPEWRNPRDSSEYYAPNDPNNPIGEHWLGLKGVSENVKDLNGYGIHGTIDPESIGRQMSLGCIRMLPNDVAAVWGVLVYGASTIEIRAD